MDVPGQRVMVKEQIDNFLIMEIFMSLNKQFIMKIKYLKMMIKKEQQLLNYGLNIQIMNLFLVKMLQIINHENDFIKIINTIFNLFNKLQL